MEAVLLSRPARAAQPGLTRASEARRAEMPAVFICKPEPAETVQAGRARIREGMAAIFILSVARPERGANQNGNAGAVYLGYDGTNLSNVYLGNNKGVFNASTRQSSGLGTTSPWAALSISLWPATMRLLFTISTSTASATSTALS